jgi:hypothetical protein
MACVGAVVSSPTRTKHQSAFRHECILARNDQQGVLERASGLFFPGDPLFGQVQHEWWKQFAPRIGIVWDPTGNGKTVIRSAYGIFMIRPQRVGIDRTRAAMGRQAPWLAPPGGLAASVCRPTRRKSVSIRVESEYGFPAIRQHGQLQPGYTSAFGTSGT